MPASFPPRPAVVASSENTPPHAAPTAHSSHQPHAESARQHASTGEPHDPPHPPVIHRNPRHHSSRPAHRLPRELPGPGRRRHHLRHNLRLDRCGNSQRRRPRPQRRDRQRAPSPDRSRRTLRRAVHPRRHLHRHRRRRRIQPTAPHRSRALCRPIAACQFRAPAHRRRPDRHRQGQSTRRQPLHPADRRPHRRAPDQGTAPQWPQLRPAHHAQSSHRQLHRPALGLHRHVELLGRQHVRRQWPPPAGQSLPAQRRRVHRSLAHQRHPRRHQWPAPWRRSCPRVQRHHRHLLRLLRQAPGRAGLHRHRLRHQHTPRLRIRVPPQLLLRRAKLLRPRSHPGVPAQQLRRIARRTDQAQSLGKR